MDTLQFDLLSTDELKAKRSQAEAVKGLYFLWSGDAIVYIGQSSNVMQRIGTHFADSRYSTPLTGYSYIAMNDGLDIYETLYIHKYQPLRNRHGKA